MNGSTRPKLLPLLAFTGLYLAAGSSIAVAAGSGGSVGIYLGLIAVLALLIYALHRSHPLSATKLWALNAWGLLHVAGGLLPIPPDWHHEGGPILYNWWLIPYRLKYDQVVHAFGFGVATWLCWHILGSALRSPDGTPVRPTPGILMLCLAGGMGFGAFNEVVEFVATLILPETNIGDYENIGWDLVANLSGSVIAVLLIRWGGRRRGNATR